MNSRCTVLLVEDDDNDAVLFERALRRLGFDGDLVRKSSPAEAWKWLSGQSGRPAPMVPDLIVSDGFQEAHGGNALFESIHNDRRYHDVPLIIYSGGMSPDAMHSATERGVLVVLKPASYADVPRVLRPALLRLPEHCRRWLKS